MELQVIEQDFRQSVGEKVSLLQEGNERYRVFTPFLFEDGDHLSIVFKRTGRDWVLSDEGNTLMRLTYEIDLRDLLRGNRQKIIDGALNTFGVANQDGELVFVVRDDAYGDALFSFVQSLIKISDVTYLSRERAKSTFLEDFRQLMQEAAPAERLEFEYHDPRHDPEETTPSTVALTTWRARFSPSQSPVMTGVETSRSRCINLSGGGWSSKAWRCSKINKRSVGQCWRGSATWPTSSSPAWRPTENGSSAI